MSLDRITLEQLLIDQTFNELTPETSALLDAYIEQNPDAAETAMEIRQTLELAGKSVSLEIPRELPPAHFNNIVPLPEPISSNTRPALLRIAAALAAGIVLGIVFSGLLPREQEVTRSSDSTAPLAFPSAHMAALDTEARTPTFWSIRSLKPKTSLSRTNNTTIVWESPTSRPQIGVR